MWAGAGERGVSGGVAKCYFAPGEKGRLRRVSDTHSQRLSSRNMTSQIWRLTVAYKRGVGEPR